MAVGRSAKRIRSTPIERRIKRRISVRIRQRRSIRRLGDEKSESAKKQKRLEDNETLERRGEEEEEEEEEREMEEEEEEREREEEGLVSGDSSGEEEDEEFHSRLLSAITELGGRRRRGQRSEATPTVSQFQLTSSSASGEVKVGDLLKGVGEEGRGVASLRRKLATTSNHQLLPPATKQQVEKAHRALAYSSACQDVGKWLPVVTHNRKADHLSFPLQEEGIPPPSLTSHAEHFQAVTEMERAVRSVVERSEDVMEATDAELTAAERAELVRVMGEEWRERVRESRKWRRLMSQYEAKCQRERRIKSRRFHRVQRKRREKVSEAGEGVGSEGVSGEGGDEERAERLRARERMTLRHSRQGKWAREVLTKRKRNPVTQLALSEHSMRGKTLTQHQLSGESEEEESDSGGEEHTNTAPPTTPPTTTTSDCHGNPWLQSSHVLLLNSSVAEGEEGEDSRDHTTSNPSHDPPTSSELKHSSHDSSPRQHRATIDPTAFITPRKEGVSLGMASQQLLHVHEAFAGDEVVMEFEREKETAATAMTETPSLTLPGWGVWGGEGTKQNKKKQVKPKKLTKPLSDRELDHVIIGDHGNVKINKHLVKRLPWPFSTTQQFNRSQATPIGRHWNSEMVHRQMVRPRVESAVGVAIPPIKLTDDVQDFMRRHDQDRNSQDRTKQRRSKQT